jgi:hypothetical protein
MSETPTSNSSSQQQHHPSLTAQPSNVQLTPSSSTRHHEWLTDSDFETIDSKEADIVSIHELFKQLKKEDRIAQRVISEFIETERRHVAKLKILKHMYKIPISKEKFLSKEEIDLIFRNNDELLDMHSE